MPDATPEEFARELIEITRSLLKAIAARDWNAYQALCDPSLSAFEPEARGQLVEGLPFHHFYFKHVDGTEPQVTMCSPHVRRLGQDAAVVSYVRLIQTLDPSGAPNTTRTEETRIWQRKDGAWRHVHFHRSGAI